MISLKPLTVPMTWLLTQEPLFSGGPAQAGTSQKDLLQQSAGWLGAHHM